MGAAGGLAALAAALAAHGLRLRGWAAPAGEGGTAPVLAGGASAAAIALIGHAGGEIWPHFEAWHRHEGDLADPLDTWSKQVIAPIAQKAGGEAVFPSDRPWHPFQRWAMAAEGLKPSPLGMLIHPLYGLWHGYRGAILFGSEAAGRLLSKASAGAGDGARHPCDACTDKPCLKTCPVDAFTKTGFAVARCRTYLGTEPGRRGCLHLGCRARDACPVGAAYRYGEAQIRFHMAAFA